MRVLKLYKLSSFHLVILGKPFSLKPSNKNSKREKETEKGGGGGEKKNNNDSALHE